MDKDVLELQIMISKLDSIHCLRALSKSQSRFVAPCRSLAVQTVAQPLGAGSDLDPGYR